MRELCLGFTNPVGTWGVLDVCLCFSCGGVGGVGLVKQFAMCLGVVAILLLNGINVFSVGGGAVLDRPCMVFQRMCVLCL